MGEIRLSTARPCQCQAWGGSPFGTRLRHGAFSFFAGVSYQYLGFGSKKTGGNWRCCLMVQNSQGNNHRLDVKNIYMKSCLNNGISEPSTVWEVFFLAPERCYFGELPWLETRCGMKWCVEFSTQKNWSCFCSWLSGKKKGPRRRCHATNEFPGLY